MRSLVVRAHPYPPGLSPEYKRIEPFHKYGAVEMGKTRSDTCSPQRGVLPYLKERPEHPHLQEIFDDTHRS